MSKSSHFWSKKEGWIFVYFVHDYNMKKWKIMVCAGIFWQILRCLIKYVVLRSLRAIDDRPYDVEWSLCADGGLCGNGFHALSSTRCAGAPSRREPFGTLRFCGGSKPPPYHGNGFCARTEAPMHKPRLCPYGARGAGRVIKFGFCPPHSVGKNPLLGESAISLWHPICTENFCVR